MKTIGQLRKAPAILAALPDYTDVSSTYGVLQRAFEMIHLFRDQEATRGCFRFQVCADGCIYAPSFVHNILSAKAGCSIVPVFSKPYEYLPGGVRNSLEVKLIRQGEVFSFGDSFAPTGFVVVPECNETDENGKPLCLQVHALDESNRAVLGVGSNGLKTQTLNFPLLTNPASTWESANVVKFTSLYKPPTKKPVSIFAYDHLRKEIGALLSIIMPWETIPFFVKYAVTGVTAATTVEALVEKKQEPIYFDGQISPFDNEEAVAHLIRASRAGDADDFQNRELHLAAALELLDLEEESKSGDQRTKTILTFSHPSVGISASRSVSD